MWLQSVNLSITLLLMTIMMMMMMMMMMTMTSVICLQRLQLHLTWHLKLCVCANTRRCVSNGQTGWLQQWAWRTSGSLPQRCLGNGLRWLLRQRLCQCSMPQSRLRVRMTFSIYFRSMHTNLTHNNWRLGCRPMSVSPVPNRHLNHGG